MSSRARRAGAHRPGRQISTPRRPNHEPASHAAPGSAVSAPVAAKAEKIGSAQQRWPARRAIIRRIIAIVVAGLTLYLLIPGITKVLGAWPRLSTLNPVWFGAALLAELASFTCNFGLQRLALRARGWLAVVTAGLTGNAVTDTLPGGDAAGAAVQVEMLTTAGFDVDTAIGGLTAFSLLGLGGLLALPIIAAPAMVGAIPAPSGRVHTAIVGLAAFVLLASFGAIVWHYDWPLAAAGRAAQRLWNRLARRHRPQLTALDRRLLVERDAVKAVLGRQWRQALLLTTGRLGFDYACLLAPGRNRKSSPPVPGPPGLLGDRGGGSAANYPGRTRHRRSKPDRPADPGRRSRRLRRPGDARLPHRGLLAAHACRRSRLSALPPQIRPRKTDQAATAAGDAAARD